LNSSKFWDGITLILALLISMVLIASVIQLLAGGAVLETFSRVTLRVINILFAVSIVLMIIVVVLENGSPANTMAWILVLIFLPGLGFAFYLLFGRNWRKRRLFSKKGYADAQLLKEPFLDKPLSYDWQNRNNLIIRLNNLLENNSKARLSFENSVQLFADTTEAFGQILAGISLAEKHVHLEYFSITADATGNALKDLLIRKAKEGVEVRFIYDDVGCWNLSKRFKRELRQAGVQLLPFMPVWIPFLNSRLNYRNHRKLVVVDGKKAFLGGLNIGDRYLGLHKYFGHWRDSVALIEGEAAADLQAIFLVDWLFVSKQNLFTQEEMTSYLPPIDNPQGTIIPMQIAASGPDSDQASIMQLYFVAITSAQRSVRISTPYLILNEGLLAALKTAAISGVKIQILLPCKPDPFMVFWASRSYFTELLEVGIEIWEYTKGFNHAKLMIVDEEVLLIGTANMDLRSFNHNFELTATVYDPAVCRIAGEQFNADLEQSSKLELGEFEQRNMIQRSKESICRLISPLL